MIGGFQPCSFIDYPGRLSAVVFLSGCNLRCPYCHNPGLLECTLASHTDDEVLSFLERRRGRLDGVVISGGEPTLYRDLGRFIASVRTLGFSIKLDTNGTRPNVVEDLLVGGLLDYVAMDLKDEPTAYANWLGMREAPDALNRSIELIGSSGVEHELRTTVIRPYHDEARLFRMARFATGIRKWVLQPFKGTKARCGHAFAPPSPIGMLEMAVRVQEEYGINCRCRSWPGMESKAEA